MEVQPAAAAPSTPQTVPQTVTNGDSAESNTKLIEANEVLNRRIESLTKDVAHYEEVTFAALSVRLIVSSPLCRFRCIRCTDSLNLVCYCLLAYADTFSLHCFLLPLIRAHTFSLHCFLLPLIRALNLLLYFPTSAAQPLFFFTVCLCLLPLSPFILSLRSILCCHS